MTRRSVALTVVCVVTLVGAALLTGIYLRPASAPEALQGSAPTLSAPVTAREFSDSRKVQVRLVPGPDVSVTANTSGVVTATACTIGGTLSSGTVAARVNDAPLLALYLSVPPFRDFESTLRGADVAALQSELQRLGYPVDADGYFGRATAMAVRDLRVAAGMPESTTLGLSEIVWIPEEQLATSTCNASLGAQVSPGTALATRSGSLQQIVMDSAPTDLVAGDRTLTVFGMTGHLPAGATSITDHGFLDALEATQDAQTVLAGDPSTQIPATLALTASIDALQVPASAVFGIANSDADGTRRGCLQSGTVSYPVIVLGSSLGASLVAIEPNRKMNPLTEVNLGAAITATNCEN